MATNRSNVVKTAQFQAVDREQRLDEETILRLLASGRTATADWLPGRASIVDIAETLAGMANARGGILVLGVTPRADRPVGVDDAEMAVNRVLEAALSITPPLIIPLPQVVYVKGAPMVAVVVPRGMPHIYALDGRYLTRDGARNVPLLPQRLRRLLLERGDVSFESEPARLARREDLDWEQVEQYVAALSGMGGVSA